MTNLTYTITLHDSDERDCEIAAEISDNTPMMLSEYIKAAIKNYNEDYRHERTGKTNDHRGL